jgi:hypothetical protein
VAHDFDDEYVSALIAHLRGGVPVVCSNPDRALIPLLEELLTLRAALLEALELAESGWRGLVDNYHHPHRADIDRLRAIVGLGPAPL